MALILDKTITGITSTTEDYGIASGYTESGYTEITYTESGWIDTYYYESGYTGTTITTGYTNITYEDSFGNIYDNPYLVIDTVDINKLIKNVRIIVSIYKNKQCRTDKKNSFFIRDCVASNIDYYNEYFLIEDMNDVNIFKQSYCFVNDKYYPNWKSDE